MVFSFIADLSTSASILLIVCLLAVCIFEAINGFHDTANAVATVIYTNTLRPMVAVVWSGIWNFLGVLLGGIAVAMSIVKLIPINDLIFQSLGENVSLVLAVLLSAIIWNLGTWYFGIPCSSSHTLIGALLGGGFGFFLAHGGEGVNWSKAADIGLSLLISPMFGFSMAIILMFLLKTYIKNKIIFKEPDAKKAPPMWIRGILVLTCTLVSFFHGSNDGQKGVGLLLVVMMAFMPLQFALNQDIQVKEFKKAALSIESRLRKNLNTVEETAHLQIMADQAGKLAIQIDSADLKNKNQVFALRNGIQKYAKALDADLKGRVIPAAIAPAISKDLKMLKSSYEFAPYWAILLISICLGIGTMIGWKRIVVTIGEKIGKSHLTYAQGASAEVCAAATIGVSTAFGLPVSTTHVLSSGIAGTMVASGGVKNLQKKTITSIALAWLLTLPVSFALAFILFSILRLLF
jgi:PiT family inorganic phosphate transporter